MPYNMSLLLIYFINSSVYLLMPLSYPYLSSLCYLVRKQCQTFFFLGSKITADGDCSHEINRRLLLGRKVMTNLESILKSRHYFANKGLSGQGYGFSSGHVWM